MACKNRFMMNQRRWGWLVNSSSLLQNAQQVSWQMNHAHGSNREVPLLIWQHSQHDIPLICIVLFVLIFICMNPMHQGLHTIRKNTPPRNTLDKNLKFYVAEFTSKTQQTLHPFSWSLTLKGIITMHMVIRVIRQQQLQVWVKNVHK